MGGGGEVESELRRNRYLDHRIHHNTSPEVVTAMFRSGKIDKNTSRVEVSGSDPCPALAENWRQLRIPR